MNKILDKILLFFNKYFWAVLFFILACISLCLYKLFSYPFLLFVAGFFTGLLVYFAFEVKNLNEKI